MATSQDKVIEYLNSELSKAREGDNHSFFFSRIKENLPQDLEKSVRDIMVEQCDFFTIKGGNTLEAYRSAHEIIAGRVNAYYSTLEYQHA